MSEYKTTVGIEVHAELKTKSKMFCGCKNDPHASEPNSNTCPVCLAHPGTLPVVNKEAVSALMQMGRAIGGELADYSEFDRKNYFYPDIPKAYQISQYKYPFVSGGEIAGVEITRVHLEEDTARSQHDQGDESLVDFNRAGVPLMELVTEPVIHDPETALKFARELQLLLRTLGISDANMDRGEMRVEANISVSKTDTFGTKVEVKNLNSFKSVEGAIKFEVKRQIELLEKGGEIIQETRGWDENRSKTFSQRTKESANDYRYFPDPDIPKFQRSGIPEFENSRIDEMMNKTPDFKRDFYSNLGLSADLIETVIASPVRDQYFVSVLNSSNFKSGNEKLAANYLTSDIAGLLESTPELEITSADPDTFASLITLVSDKTLTSRVAKDLLPEVVFEGLDPLKTAESRGLLQNNNEDELKAIVASVIAEHTDVADEYRAGKESALQFFIGQGMKATKGSANPGVLADLFRSELSSQ